jgi:hypothetical protein
MFEIHNNQIIQFLLTGIIAAVFAILSYIGIQRSLFALLIIFIPFQLIDSMYGSLNMVLTYVLGCTMFINRKWMRKKNKIKVPYKLSILLILFVFILSLTQSNKLFLTKNLFYFIMILSNFIILIITYNFISTEKDIHTLFKILYLSNCFVVIYCLFQFIIGYEEFKFLGIKELSLHSNRLDYRIVGPYNAAGITAEYLVIQTLLIGYYSLFQNDLKKTSFILIFANLLILIGTGNRGGFICLILGTLLFNMFFWRKLKFKNIITINTVLTIIFCLSSYYMIKYTDFNVLYERLLRTEINGMTPDTRKGWPYVVEKIAEKPILGHGPMIVTSGDFGKKIQWPKSEINFYPHNLYLAILYSYGIIGFLAYSIFGFAIAIKFHKNKYIMKNKNRFLSGIPRIGIIVFIVFIIDQMKIEFNRWSLLDYQHYTFFLLALFSSLERIKFKNENDESIVA